MSVGEVIDQVLRWLFLLGIPGAAGWYVKERRKSRAADEVAVATVPADIRTKDAGALEAHVVAIERAFEVERESKDRQIAEQARQIAELKQGRRDDAERIGALSAQVRELKDQVQYLTSLTQRLASPDQEDLS